MGSTHRFLALDGDVQSIRTWLTELPVAPAFIQGRGCEFIHFAALGGLKSLPESEEVDVNRSPIASLFWPLRLRSVLWTAGELHFLPTPLGGRFPELEATSRRFAKWLRGFECVYKGPGTTGEWDYYLEGQLRNHESAIFALPEAMKALRRGQYFVEHGIREEPLDRLCRMLELRGVVGGRDDGRAL